MLKLRFVRINNTILDIKTFFNSESGSHWLDKLLEREMIKDVDKSEAMKGRYIESLTYLNIGEKLNLSTFDSSAVFVRKF